MMAFIEALLSAFRTGAVAPQPPAAHPEDQGDVNERAALDVLAACEGTLGQNGYRALYGYHPTKNADHVFSGFDDHPRVKFWPDGRRVPPGVKPAPYSYTTAAGRYQITETTNDRLDRKLGTRGFWPRMQDRKAIELMAEAGGRGAIRIGDLEQWAQKCSPIWASLPWSKAGQPTRTMEFIRKAYLEAGGKEG